MGADMAPPLPRGSTVQAHSRRRKALRGAPLLPRGLTQRSRYHEVWLAAVAPPLALGINRYAVDASTVQHRHARSPAPLWGRNRGVSIGWSPFRRSRALRKARSMPIAIRRRRPTHQTEASTLISLPLLA